MLHGSQANRLLGCPADARLLIVNADDFGMHQAINQAITQALMAGLVRSTTLMVPCPAASSAMDYLREHPDIAFGVHLTAIRDTVSDEFGPLTARSKVPSLVDETGYFYAFDQMAQFFAQVRLDELETEFRAQIEAVLAAGLKPTHLDWHSLRVNRMPEITDVMFGLAREYGLALRVMGRSSIEQVQQRGLPANDDDFLDSTSLDLAGKSARFVQLLRELPAGLSEWAVHPGMANAELRAAQPTLAQIRQTDYDFLISQEAQDVVKEEGIILMDYRPLQAVWRETSAQSDFVLGSQYRRQG